MGRRGIVERLGAAAALAALLAAGTLVAPAGARGSSPTPTPASATAKGRGCTESPFTARFDAALRSRWPNRIAAAVYDTRSGCTYLYRPELRITTASVLKAEIMGGILLRAQRAGRGLTAQERSLVGPMISFSNDAAAGALWSSLGGVAAMRSLDQQLGLGQTAAAAPWGLTSTSALDRTNYLRQLILGQYGPFSAASRAQAKAFMLAITPSQDWGITAGVPGGFAVPLKNGFFPASCCGWRVNTSGVVERPGGGAYVATVLSDGWPTEGAGIAAVEFVSRDIAAWTLRDVGPLPSPARFADQAYVDVLGRGPTYGEEQALAAAVAPDPRRASTQLSALLSSAAVDATSGQLLRLYLTALHRLPTPSSWSGRMAQLRAHATSLQDLAGVVASSSELTGGHHLSDPDFVDRAYQRAFGRLPSGHDRAYWVHRLDTGTRRGTLLLDLSNTNTLRFRYHQRVKVAEAYLALLRLRPSTGVSGAWERKLWAGTPFSDLTGALFATETYADRFR